MSDQTGITSSSMEQSHSFWKLFTPSLWSGFLCLTVSFVALMAVVGQIHYRAGDFYSFFGIQPQQAEVAQSSVADGYDTVVDRLDSNQAISTVPLMIFWGVTGVIVYWFTIMVFRAAQTLNELRRSVDYVHTSKQAIILEPLEKLGIRLLVLAALYGWLKLTFGTVIPYIVALAYAASGSFNVESLKYFGLALIVSAACLHGFVILTRALLLRPRVFSQL